MYKSIENCRACGSNSLQNVLEFGDMPLVDRLVPVERLDDDEPSFPLTVTFCDSCSLLQLRETVSPDLLYCQDYPYYSSFLNSWVEHCRANAHELVEMRGLDDSSLVIEIACNDGYMLKSFVEKGVPVLGVDPAEGPAQAARESGIPVIVDFFSLPLAQQLRDEGRQADVIAGNNVLAHVGNLGGFVDGVATALKDDGVAVFECPYVRDLIDHCEFDTIYHEHHCYYSVTALANLFASHGLHLNDVRRLPTHGGSLRIYVEHKPNPTQALSDTLAAERSIGLDAFEYYRSFADQVHSVQDSLRNLLSELKGSGKQIAAYAAAAKGATLLNSTGIGTAYLDYVVDRNRHKHGKHMPGVHVPICDTSRLLDDQPDYVLLLAWNHKEEILRQQAEYCSRGGKFIVPIPEPQLL